MNILKKYKSINKKELRHFINHNAFLLININKKNQIYKSGKIIEKLKLKWFPFLLRL
jgi:hypothetical protein